MFNPDFQKKEKKEGGLIFPVGSHTHTHTHTHTRECAGGVHPVLLSGCLLNFSHSHTRRHSFSALDWLIVAAAAAAAARGAWKRERKGESAVA